MAFQIANQRRFHMLFTSKVPIPQSRLVSANFNEAIIQIRKQKDFVMV